ncbi:MAG: hypothetical protein WC829_18250 [Hyphomicrobium sp.]|jgi:hypothetical protein
MTADLINATFAFSFYAIGYVSYNGRVWAGTPQGWKSSDRPLYG